MRRNDSLLDGEFELNGAWWLPENPENQIRGTLHFKGGDRILLNLHGAFQAWPQTEFLKPPLILGLSEDGAYCTLLDNIQASAKPSLTTDLHRSSFLCTKLLMGAVYSSIGKHASRSEILCKHECGVTLTPTHPRPLAWFDEQRRVFEQLMTLLVGEPVYPVAATGLLEVLDAKGQRRTESVKVYLGLTGPRVRDLLEPQMLLTWRRAPSEVPAVVEQWYDKADSLEPVHTLYFATRYNRSAYVESEFLMLVQALESLHRCTSSGTYVSWDEYRTYADRMLAALPQNTPNPLRDRLVNYLTYGNELSLRKRLEELFRQLPEAAKPRLFKKESDFVELIVETRNHLAHPSSEPRDKALNDVLEYWGTNLTLSQILTILLFQSVGISERHLDLNRLFHS